MSDDVHPLHPGSFVRENILNPRCLTVTKAAQLIGVSRPALSNFLNGKSSASQNMAGRLESAFGIPSKDILDMQAAYDAEAAKTAHTTMEVRAYVPPFLKILANDITERFSGKIPERTQLSVLLRTLIHSTGGGELQKVDFPGNDDAERSGWDGFIEAGAGTPWIPLGTSGWEFGVTKNIKKKADGDYDKSLDAVKPEERVNITFVFVTPQRWPRKTTWIAEKKNEKLWKDVRAYDASDLEQWMEQSPAAQTWFANLEKGADVGVRSLDRCWDDWATVTDPELHPSLFDTVNKAWYEILGSFLTKDDVSPLIITADSTEEALAFLSRALAAPELESHRDRVLVFDKTGKLPKLAQANTDFIAVIHTREVERELGPFSHSLKSILVYPRNTVVKPDVVLEPINFDAFSKALQAMGKPRDEINKLARASGRSLTVLRRQLAKIPAVRKPAWAEDSTTASKLVPLVLAGAWNTRNKADQKILSELAGTPFETVEKHILDLLRLNDSPIWSVGEHQGVISKIDSLFAIAGSFSGTDLDRFLEVAREVLGEDDPALDLPESSRYAATLYGKKREFSRTLRESISETLVLLSVYGKDLFEKLLGFDGETAAARLVRTLLTPLTTRKLEANRDELPLYAEAAPTEFLNIIERDLRAEEPKVMNLLKPVDNTLFCSCPRTGLLWALEGLAWNPATFPRVVTILGQLSEIEIDDNWGNKPIESLGMIFRAWMPQTAADHEMRLKAVKMLLNKHPSVGWKICLQQIHIYGRCVGDYSYKPKWRPDGYGFGRPFTKKESVQKFIMEMVEIALTRPSYSVEMLCDLLSMLNVLTPKNQDRVWKIILKWYKDGAPDEEIVKIRETIRVPTLSRLKYAKIDEKSRLSFSKKAKSIYAKLQPKDSLYKYVWLFRQGWVEPSVEEHTEGLRNLQEREQHLRKLRSEALTNIFQERGIPGILALSEKGKAQLQIGYQLVNILTDGQLEELFLNCLRSTENNSCLGDIITGALRTLNNDERKRLFTSLRDKVSKEEVVRLLLLFPYQASTWELVDQLSTEARNRYWAEVVPECIYVSKEENNESVQRLLKARRPRAAFDSVQPKLEEIDASFLAQILSAMMQKGNDKPGEYLLNSYDIERAFNHLNLDPNLSSKQKAALEFAYLEVLSRPIEKENQQRIPNLENYIEKHPELFVQAIAWAFGQKNHDEEYDEHLAKKGYQLLEAIKRVPGQDKDSPKEQYDKLSKWIIAVKSSCSKLDLEEIADYRIGILLSNASPGKDGIWPNETIREVMEDQLSDDISKGACTGLYNARGVHPYGEGGNQERELADKYRSWAEELQFTHPFVSTSLLMSMVHTYEREAELNDTEADLHLRLRH